MGGRNGIVLPTFFSPKISLKIPLREAVRVEVMPCILSTSLNQPQDSSEVHPIRSDGHGWMSHLLYPELRIFIGNLTQESDFAAF